MSTWRTRTAGLLLAAPLALTAACSDEAGVDGEAPSVDVSPGDVDVDAPNVPDVDVDADVETEGG